MEIVTKEDAEREGVVPSSFFARWSFAPFRYSGHHLEQARQTFSATVKTVPGQYSWCERGVRRRLPIKSVNVRLVFQIYWGNNLNKKMHRIRAHLFQND